MLHNFGMEDSLPSNHAAEKWLVQQCYNEGCGSSMVGEGGKWEEGAQGGRHLSSDWEFIFLPETEVVCYFVFSEALQFLLEHFVSKLKD